MLTESRDEYEQRRFDIGNAGHNRESVEPGHLDIEEHQIGLHSLDGADRLAAIGAAFDNLDVV